MIGGACGTHGGGAIIVWNTISVAKHEGKIKFERHTPGWEDNIRVHLASVWCGFIGLNSTFLRAVVKTVMSLRFKECR